MMSIIFKFIAMNRKACLKMFVRAFNSEPVGRNGAFGTLGSLVISLLFGNQEPAKASLGFIDEHVMKQEFDPMSS